MSDDKKPKDLSALKARLKGGKPAGGAPPAGGVVPPPGGVVPPPGGVVPPGGIARPPAAGGIAPPAAKPGGLPLPGALGKGAGIAPPPFAKPAAPTGPDLSRDPFAVARPGSGGGGEVRLVIDERVTVDDKETGRGKKLGIFVTFGVAFATLALGYCGGSAMKDRIIFNRSVRDAREIKSVVENSAKVLGGAKARVEQAINLANTKKQADIPAAEFLRSLKKPIDAGSFSRRNYIAFEPNTVDNLFDYYNGVNRLWDNLAVHVAKTLADRDSLTKSQETIDMLATSQFGCVLRGEGEGEEQQFEANLGIVEPKEGGAPDEVLIRSRPGSPTAERKLFRGGELLATKAADFVIPINQQNNSGLLASTIAPFRDYAGRLQALNASLQELTQTQTQLMTALGDLSNLEELATIGD